MKTLVMSNIFEIESDDIVVFNYENTYNIGRILPQNEALDNDKYDYDYVVYTQDDDYYYLNNCCILGYYLE